MDVKSGKGIRDGVVSELAAFFHIKPGHEAEARAACARFADSLRASDPLENQKTGLRDSRHVLEESLFQTQVFWNGFHHEIRIHNLSIEVCGAAQALQGNRQLSEA